MVILGVDGLAMLRRNSLRSIGSRLSPFASEDREVFFLSSRMMGVS